MRLFGIQIRSLPVFRGEGEARADVKERRHPARLKDTFVLARMAGSSARSPRSMPESATWPFDKWVDIYHDAGPNRLGAPAVPWAALPALRWPLAVATPSTLRFASRRARRTDAGEFLAALDPERAWGGRHARYFDPLRFLALGSAPGV